MRTKAIAFTCLLFSIAFSVRAQCGLDPTTGAVSISTVNQIVNSYYPGIGSPAVSTSTITLGAIDMRGSATAIASGDLILIMQVQGADINSTNTNSYGDGIVGGLASGYLTSNLVAGNYEYNSVAAVAGATITLSYSLANSYFTRPFGANGIQSFQVIRIPRYFDFGITGAGSVTCPAWNGITGGVVALDAANVMTIDGSINVSGLGFRGGGGIQLTGATTGNTNGTGTLTNTDYRWDSPFTNAANLSGGAKGEGISGTPVYILATGATTITINTVEGYLGGSMGRGAPGNAGGGATDGAPVGAGSQNQYNTGGGGGANAGAGGKGGSGWHGGSGNLNTYPTGGDGGTPFAERSVSRFVMGGGGGAGTANNSTAANQYMSSGGAGGGIILLRAKSYAGTGILNADGANAVGVVGGGPNTDAAGGGGGGGSIIAVTRGNVVVGLTGVIASAKGGNGGNMDTYFDHGPGGGGGGGIIISNGLFSGTSLTGGANGFTRTGTSAGPLTNAFGASPGANGQLRTLSFAPFLKNVNNVASPCGILPITLESFSASVNNSTVVLKWTVDQAINFSHFEIEYGNDGINFSNIGQITFNATQSAYQFFHSPIVTPVNFYRLKMIDANGNYHYSPVLIVRTDAITAGLKIFPQPASTSFVATIKARQSQMITLQLFNSAGSKVKEIPIQLIAGSNAFVVNDLELLPHGIYSLRTFVDGKIITQKVVIARK